MTPRTQKEDQTKADTPSPEVEVTSIISGAAKTMVVAAVMLGAMKLMFNSEKGQAR